MKPRFTKAFLTFTIPLFLTGFLSHSDAAMEAPPYMANRPYLQFSIEDNYQVIGPSKVDNQYSGNISYEGVSNVCVTIGGETIPLEQAVKEEKCSVEELIAYAQVDARLGLCTEGECTYNGLTKFTYTYPDYMLITIHDVYETPNGTNYTINYFTVTTPQELTPAPIGYTDMQTGQYLDLEDWGITFTPTEITEKGILIETTQQGGQNFGDLYLTDFYLVSEPDREYLGETMADVYLPITMGGTGTIQLDWNQAMPAGDYTLVVRLEEIYNRDEMPSLMRNYHDTQQYLIPITIPQAP